MSYETFANAAKKMMQTIEMSPPLEAMAPPRPIIPAPTILFVRLKTAPVIEDPFVFCSLETRKKDDEWKQMESRKAILSNTYHYLYLSRQLQIGLRGERFPRQQIHPQWRPAMASSTSSVSVCVPSLCCSCVRVYQGQNSIQSGRQCCCRSSMLYLRMILDQEVFSSCRGAIGNAEQRAETRVD